MRNNFTITTAIAVLLIACQSVGTMGIKKDLNTGLTTTYNRLRVENAFLVMNQEKLNHTDIPLGESFQLINEDVAGLTLRDGKISVGCSLLIQDSAGRVLLREEDLFKGNDTFDKENARYLKCTVNTGAPMESEEHYTVKVDFWDKYGEGRISNSCKIRAIDMP